MSDLMDDLLRANPATAAMRILRQREQEFTTPKELALTALGMTPDARALADDMLDRQWSDPGRVEPLLASAGRREVIVGSGYHAAVYAAVRVLNGYPRPLVIEKADRAGGTFAMTRKPTFYLNSRNRGGRAGLGGDRFSSLNYLPGAPVQLSNLTMAEYPTNTDMAFVIRMTLAEYADVITGVEVLDRSNGTSLQTTAGAAEAGRVIMARGLGEPRTFSESLKSPVIQSFPEFMKRMELPFPLRGVRKIAVVGGGDSAKCAVEALIGVGPVQAMSVPALDSVQRIDWYASDLPEDCVGWRQGVRGRYQAIGPSLRADRYGNRLVNVINRRVLPVPLTPGQVTIEGQSYDLVIAAIGTNTTNRLPNDVFEPEYEPFQVNGVTVARQGEFDRNMFRIGVHANLPFTDYERRNGVADIANNKVAMFRTGPKTAALASQLPAVV